MKHLKAKKGMGIERERVRVRENATGSAMQQKEGEREREVLKVAVQKDGWQHRMSSLTNKKFDICSK